MALTANTPLTIIRGELSEVPAAAVEIFEGACLGDNGAGYARGLVAGDAFRGHAMEYINNSAGSAGAVSVECFRGRYRLKLAISGVAITDVGRAVYASADNTYTLVAGGNSRIGTVVRYSESGYAIVACETVASNAVFSARSRAVTALPTAAITSKFDIEGMLKNPMAGSLLFADFARGGDLPDVTFVDATYAASAAGKTLTEGLYIGTDASGALVLMATTDNQGAECQWACPITVSGSGAWAFGVRIKQSVLTDSKAGVFAGLMVPQALAGDLIADGATLQAEGSLGFQLKEADGDSIDLVYDKTGQTQNEHDGGYAVPVADTYNVLELYCDGDTIQGYLDGVLTGTAILAADIAAADFPAATVMVPTLAMKNGHADTFISTTDWIYAIQAAS